MLMRHYEIFRSPSRIQTLSGQVSCTGGWAQIAEQEILIVVASLVKLRTLLLHHSYAMLPMYSSQQRRLS